MLPQIAKSKAQVFVKQHFKSLALLYIIIQFNGLALYIAATFIEVLTENIYVYAFCLFLAACCSFIAACKLTQRVKDRLLCKQAITPGGLCATAMVYALSQLFPLFAQFPYLGGIISATAFIINTILLPFFLFSIFTSAPVFQKSIQLFKKAGLDYFRLLIKFIPLYALSALISRLPAYYLVSILTFNSIYINILTTAVTAITCIVSIIPMYTEINLYTAIFYLFSDATE